MRRLKLISLLFVLALLLSQCQRPFGVLNEKKMRAVTKDLILTEAYLQQSYMSDSAELEMYERIFAQHGVTRAEYDSSFVWYSANPHRLADIYTQIKAEFENTKAVVDTFLVDSVNRYRVRFEPLESLWSNESRLYIPAQQRLFAYSQSLYDTDNIQPSDTLFWSASQVGSRPDTLSLNMKLLVMNQEGYRYAMLRGSEIESEGLSLKSYFVLPDSLPIGARYTLFILLQKSTQPLQLQIIRFSLQETEKIQSSEEELDSEEISNQEFEESRDEAELLEGPSEY